MQWRDALFAHWPIAPELVDDRLPDRLSVRTYDGDAWLGIVPFEMAEIGVRGVPIGRSFPELNLRTYVDGPQGPGVYFFNLDADDRLSVALARRLFALPYYAAEMSIVRDAETVTIASRRTHDGVPPARFRATYRPTSDVYRAEPGSIAAFLVENYRFYAAGNRLYYGEINHEPWPLQDGEIEIRSNTLFEAEGFEKPAGEPIVHYSRSIDVTADRLRRA